MLRSVLRTRLLLPRAFLLSALLIATVPVSSAVAGTYSAAYDFVGKPGVYSGWSVQSNVSGKSYMCGLNQNNCAGRTVLSQSTVGVGAWTKGEPLGTQNLARVAFVPPPNTVLSGMAIDLQRVVENNGYMKVQIGGKVGAAAWGSGTPFQSILSSTIGTATYSPSGTMSDGYYVQLINTSDSTQTPNVRNGFSIKRATATLVDSTAPEAAWVENAEFDKEGWYTGGNACATVKTTDSGGGVTAVSLEVDGTSRGTVPKASGSPNVPGITGESDTQLCVDTANLTDGTHVAQAVVSDAGGITKRTALAPFKVARTSPTLSAIMAPAASSGDTTPTFQLRINAGVSGCDSGELYVDENLVQSEVCPAADGTATVSVDTPLAVGNHTWRARIVDKTGRAAEIRGVFTIILLTTGVTITPLQVPEPISTNRTPTFRFRLNRGNERLDAVDLYIDFAKFGDWSKGDSFGYSVSSDTQLSIGRHSWEVVAITETGASVRLEGTFEITDDGITDDGITDDGAKPSGKARLVVPKSVSVRNGQVRLVVRVVQGTKGVKGRTVTCTRGGTKRRVRTNAKGDATCVLPFRSGSRTITVSVAGIAKKKITIKKPAKRK